MKKIVTLSFVMSVAFAFGQINQGLVNNGAYIVLGDGANIYIDGSSGHYSAYTDNSQDGMIRTHNGNGVIKVAGSWINDSGDVGFANDGTTVELIGSTGFSQIVRGTHPTTFDTLRLLGTDNKVIVQDISVGGLVAKTGLLELNDKMLELNQRTLTITNQSAGAFTRSSGYLQSETDDVIGTIPNPAGGNVNIANNHSIVRWEVGTNTGSYVFPLGTTNGDYIPVGINKTSNESNAISISTRPTVGGDNQPWTNGVTSMSSSVLGTQDATITSVIDRWWDIIPDNNALQADVSLTYVGSENTTPNTAGTFALQKWNTTLGNWETQIGSGVSATGAGNFGAVTAPGVDFSTGNGIFIISSLNPAGPLPVQLLGFSAKCDDLGVTVKWTTGSELNSDFFIVQRSRDGISWETVAEIEAAGNSTTTKEYEVFDKNAPSTAYYKLVQVDLDGKQEEYGPVSSDCNDNPENLVTLYPNPTSGKFTLEVINNFNDEDASIQIMDLAGRIVETRDALFTNGTNHLIFDSYSFVKGTYVLKIISEKDYTPIKFVVF